MCCTSLKIGANNTVAFSADDHCVAVNVSGAASKGGMLDDLNVSGKMETAIEVPPIVSKRTDSPPKFGASDSNDTVELNASVTFKLLN